MAKSPVREYAILYAGKNGRSSSASSILGGAAITSTPQHALDGPEHTSPADLTRLNASEDAHGLLPKLSGAASDFLDGTGAWSSPAGSEGSVFSIERQVLQTGRYLDRAGQWRDPLVVGDGVLAAAGSPAAIVNTSKYDAWPSRVKLHDGRHLVVFTEGDSHHADNTGKAMGIIGVEALDGSIDWTASGGEFVIYDDPSVWVSAVGVSVLSTGRVVVSVYYGNYSTDPLDGAAIIYSDDVHESGAAATWGAPIVVNSSLTSFSYGSGRVLELGTGGTDSLGRSCGTLIQFVEGKNSGDTFSRMVALKSVDGGDTWGSQLTIASGTRDYFEGCPVLLDNNDVLILLRTSDGDGDIYGTISTDSLATQPPAPTLAFPGHGQPNVIQSSTRTILAATRSNEGDPAQGSVWIYSTSRDRVTADMSDWSSPLTLDSSMYDAPYASIAETTIPARYAVAYGYQPTSSISNDDIYEGFFTEGLTTFGAAVTAADVSIVDVDGHFAATDVEGALAELASEVATSTSYRVVVMMPGITHPPNPVETPDGASWVYGLVSAP